MPGTFYDNDEFMSEFGRIIHVFAASEENIKLAIAAMCDLPPDVALILQEPYGSGNLKNVAKSIAKINLHDNIKDEFISLVGNIVSFSKLRNYIAHSRWNVGTRPESFKPMSLNIRGDRADYLGLEDDEKDWTAKELNVEYQKLYKHSCDLIDFMSKHDFFTMVEKRLAEQEGKVIGG